MLTCIPHLLYSFAYRQTLGWFPISGLLWIMLHWIWEYRYLLEMISVPLDIHPHKAGIAGSYGIFNFLRTLHIFYNGWRQWHSPQQYTGFPFLHALANTYYLLSFGFYLTPTTISSILYFWIFFTFYRAWDTEMIFGYLTLNDIKEMTTGHDFWHQLKNWWWSLWERIANMWCW